jgi:hypothetical protein
LLKNISAVTQNTETELMETGVSFAVLPSQLKYRSSRELQFELQRDPVQLKESSRYKETEEKSAEAKTSEYRPRQLRGWQEDHLPRSED